MNDILKKLSLIGIVPVIKLDDVNDASSLAKALIKGGLPCAEVTFRTDAAEGSIKLISEQFPEMLVGAGTVLTTEQVDKAVAAGAKFIVSPGLNPKVVSYCVERSIPIVPGCASASDIERAIELGLDVVKFFPAEQAGGISMIKALSAPYVNMKFMPTGGINLENLNNYLTNKKVLACGGSFMVSAKLINDKNFDEITRLTKNAVSTMLGFELAHVGINCETYENAKLVASKFDSLFETGTFEKDNAFFCGKFIETMGKSSPGTCGHIGVKTNNINRAIYQLEQKGCKFDDNSKLYDEKGNLILIYLQDEIGGFSVHLSQKKEYL